MNRIEGVARGAGERVVGADDGGTVLESIRQLAVEGGVRIGFSHSLSQSFRSLETTWLEY